MAQINEYKTIWFKLDGKQNIYVPIDIKRNGRYVTDPVDVIVKGYLKFKDSTSDTDKEVEESSYDSQTSNNLVDKTVVYPVLFTSDRVRVSSGRLVVTLLARSEDLFESTSQVHQGASLSVQDSDIIAEGGIPKDEQVADIEKDVTVMEIETGEIREPYKISLGVTVIPLTGEGSLGFTIDRGTVPKVETTKDVNFLFQKEKKRSSSNLIMSCFNNEDWVPVIGDVIGNNEGTEAEILQQIDNLKYSTSFGTSTMYDAIIAGARILSDSDVNDVRKLMYLFTDNETSASTANLNETIEEVNNIDGYQKVPILSANMNIVQPETLSVKANSSDTRDLNKLSYLTGGQSMTVNSEDYIDDVTVIFYSEVVGSLGYGAYEFTVDLQEEALINYVSASFDIPVDTGSATWEIETSTDGYNFTAIGQTYAYNETVDLEDIYAKYIKFKVVLVTSFSSEVDEYGAYPDSPALTVVTIVHNKSKVAYLYLNKQEVDIMPYQITMAVDANEVNDDQIKVGVAKSDSHNWNDYHLDSQPSVDQNGKVVIPIRFSQDITEFQQEPLSKVDRFVLQTEHGNWDPFASAILYDSSDAVIPSDRYSLDPREGLVILNYAVPSNYTTGDYKIGILNLGNYKVGMKLTNKSQTTPLEIYGMGYLYTTSRNLLPPLSKASPEARDVSIVNTVPTKFGVIEASYTYYDSNYDTENTDNRKISWYINGSYIKYLDNLMEWNDLTDPRDQLYENTSLIYPSDLGINGTIEEWAKKQGASLLNAGDQVYYEIQVNDGELYSAKEKSNMAIVVESTPVMDQIFVRAKDDITGKVSNRVTAYDIAVIDPPLDQVFYADGEVNRSEIVWYVNNEIFKRGYYGDPVGFGGYKIDEIGVNEVGSVNFGDYGLRMGNSIYVQVTPRTATTVGSSVTSETIAVQNSLPVINSLDFSSTRFQEKTDMFLNWVFFDFEVTLINDVDESFQKDQTMVRWYRKNSGSESELVYAYNDQDNDGKEIFYETSYTGYIKTGFTPGVSTSIVSGDILVVGQEWYAMVTPYDTIDNGIVVRSETKTITARTN